MLSFLFQHKRGERTSPFWTARVRLPGWLRPREFHLHVKDKRVAQQKLAELIVDLEREAAGVGTPRIERNAAQTPLAEHLKAFAEDARSAGRRRNTIVKYEQGLLKLCKRCRWVTLRDVTEESFIAWRKKSGLSPEDRER